MRNEHCDKCDREINEGYHCVACCMYITTHINESKPQCFLCRGALNRVTDSNGKILKRQRECRKCNIKIHCPINQKWLRKYEKALASQKEVDNKIASIQAMALQLHDKLHENLNDGSYAFFLNSPHFPPEPETPLSTPIPPESEE